MWLARSGNLIMLYQSLAQIQQQLLHILLGLNRICYFDFKWLDVVSDRLAQKPVDLMRHLRQVYQLEPAEGAQELVKLVEETYDLVEKQFPQIDVGWLRTVFHSRRPVSITRHQSRTGLHSNASNRAAS
jgi:hypothetical protein